MWTDKFEGVLLVSDYDDTLYGSNFHVSAKNRQAIRTFIAQGGIFTIATGREMKAFTPQIQIEKIPLNAPVVLSNGATIFDYETDKLVRRTYLSDEILHDISCVSQKFPELGIEAYYQNEVFVYNPNVVTQLHLKRVGIEGSIRPIEKFSLPLIKVILMHPDKSYLIQTQEYLKQAVGDRYEVIFSNDFLLELTEKNSHKGGAVSWLADQWRISRDNLYCIGDNQNDLPMLEIAHIGFAPENCSQEVRDWGARIVRSCDNDCVAQVIEILDSLYCD